MLQVVEDEAPIYCVESDDGWVINVAMCMAFEGLRTGCFLFVCFIHLCSCLGLSLPDTSAAQFKMALPGKLSVPSMMPTWSNFTRRGPISTQIKKCET